MTHVIWRPRPATDAPGAMVKRTEPHDSGPFARFRRDHRRVLARITALERATADPDAAPPRDAEMLETLEMLARHFATHMIAEDTVLFPALAEAFPEARATLAPLRAEHVDLRLMLATLTSTFATPAGPERDEQLVVQTRDFVHLLRIHIAKEERSVFDLTERVLRPGEARDLADRLESCFPPTSRGARTGRRKGTPGS